MQSASTKMRTDGRTATAVFQGEIWGRDARTWATLQEPLGVPLWQAALDEAGVGRGTRVLDLGCGAGGASLLAARRGARVSGLDASGPLVEIARETVPAGDFRTGDIEALPYLDGSFDVVLAMNVLQYAEDTLRAVQEIRRVLAPNGVLVVGSWGPPEASDASALMAALKALTPATVPAPTVLSLAGPGALEAALARGGLRPGASRDVRVDWAFPDADTLVRVVSSGGPMQAALRAVGETALRDALLAAAEPFRQPSGIYRLRNTFRTLTATP